MNYVIGKCRARGNACHLKDLEGVPDDFELAFGVPRVQGFPVDAYFRMSADFPKAGALTDALANTGHYFVASARLRAFLASVPGALFQNEILPVRIINHKGRVEKSEYAIIHQVHHPKCLDMKQCIGTRHAINPSHFQFMDKIVLDEQRIDPRLMLFRPEEYGTELFIHRGLATKLQAEKFTGISFEELANYSIL